jgi:hypothetical protein
LSKLSDGNQIYTTDFRSVYATAFENILGMDPKPFPRVTLTVRLFVPTRRQASSVRPRCTPRADRLCRPAPPAARSYRVEHG